VKSDDTSLALAFGYITHKN